MQKNYISDGKHVIIDIRSLSRELCLNDELWLEVMEEAAKSVGMKVINTVRYFFNPEITEPGCTAFVTLDSSHVSVHTYANRGTAAVDAFTCGDHDPETLWSIIKERLGIEDFDLQIVDRFKRQNHEKKSITTFS